MRRMETSPAASPELLDAVIRETGPTPAWSVLWLHGLGDSGDGFAPIVPELLRPDWPALRFVFPHAPVRAVTINNGMRMRAWYDILDFSNLANRADETGVDESVRQVEALIEREIERGIPASRILLAGFSQGGAIVLQTALRHPGRLAGVLALSTYLPLAGTLAKERSEASKELPIFMAHGQFDDIIPIKTAAATKTLLEKSGYDVEWHDYPMPHSLCNEEIADIRDFILRVLPEA